MAPAFSRARTAGPFLPSDVIYEIACLVDVPTRRALLLCCSEYHHPVARVLYRSIYILIESPDRGCKYLRHAPFHLLSSLIRSMHPKTGVPPRVNAQYLVTFAYVSTSTRANFRAAPLLGEVFRAAVRLRHLRLDIADSAVDGVLDALRRAQVIILPSTTFAGRYTARCRTDQRVLPSLESVRSTSLAIIEALMRYRSIDTVILDAVPNDKTLGIFLRTLPPWDPTTLRRLALSYCSVDFEPFLVAVFASFPCLEQLSVRVPRRGFPALQFATEAVSVLAEKAYVPHLQMLAVGQVAWSEIGDEVLELFGTHVQKHCTARPALRMVIVGSDTMWSRKHAEDALNLTEICPIGNITWLANRNHGKWMLPWQMPM